MPGTLLDTTILIDLMAGSEGAIRKVEELRKKSPIYTTTLNIYEILRGMMMTETGRKKRLEALEVLAASINVLDFDAESAREAAGIYAELRRIGRPISEPDYMIGGTCIANGVEVIVTKNIRHFENASPSLKIETY